MDGVYGPFPKSLPISIPCYWKSPGANFAFLLAKIMQLTEYIPQQCPNLQMN